MDLVKTLKASIGFLGRSLRPDDFQKLVLPVLMTLILVLGVFSTFDLQQSYGEESLNLTLESLTDQQVLQVRDRHFPETMDKPLNSAVDESNRDLRSKINEMRSRPLFMPKGLLSRMIFESGAFPLIPERMLAPWNPEEEYVRAVGLLRYRNDRIADLGEKADGSYTYSEFQKDVESIRSKEYRSENVQAFLENSTGSDGATLSFLEDVSLDKVISDGVNSISVLDFLPSFFATFIIYYLIGAVSVQGNKELVEKVFGSDDEFENLGAQSKREGEK